MLRTKDVLQRCIDKASDAILDANTILELSQATGFYMGLLNGLRMSGVITREMYNQAFTECEEILKRRIG